MFDRGPIVCLEVLVYQCNFYWKCAYNQSYYGRLGKRKNGLLRKHGKRSGEGFDPRPIKKSILFTKYKNIKYVLTLFFNKQFSICILYLYFIFVTSQLENVKYFFFVDNIYFLYLNFLWVSLKTIFLSISEWSRSNDICIYWEEKKVLSLMRAPWL